MNNIEVTFQSEEYSLGGTLSLPEKGEVFPAVLLIPGSGQIDRNENHKKLKLNVFYDLANHLTSQGYAVLRYDKRGMAASEGDFWSTGFYDNAADALNAVEFLKKQQRIDTQHIYLLGHSEGALIASHLAAGHGDIAGLILLAGSAKSGEEALLWQGKKVVEGMKGLNKWLIDFLHIDVVKSQQKQLDKIKKSKKDFYRIQFISKINAKWMRELLAYNPAEDLARVACPVLAITGSKDIQVDPDDLLLMKDIVTSPFEFHILPGVTHLLRMEEGEASISNYKRLVSLPLDTRIPQIISEWLNQQTTG